MTTTTETKSDWYFRRTRQRALYPRQKEALGLYALGNTYENIAAQLGVAVGTARSYIGGAVVALGAENPKEAVELARASGDID